MSKILVVNNRTPMISASDLTFGDKLVAEGDDFSWVLISTGKDKYQWLSLDGLRLLTNHHSQLRYAVEFAHNKGATVHKITSVRDLISLIEEFG